MQNFNVSVTSQNIAKMLQNTDPIKNKQINAFDDCEDFTTLLWKFPYDEYKIFMHKTFASPIT